MMLYQIDGFHNFAASVPDEGILLTLDSFVFLKPIILECYDAEFQIRQNFDRVVRRIAANPEVVRTNFEDQLFGTLSGSIGVYSQVYYRDMVSLNKVLGDLVFRNLVREVEDEN